MIKLLKDFRAFLLQGNLVTLATAFIIATVFAALVKAFIDDILMQIVALIVGKPNFGTLSFTIHHASFAYGDFINALITFVATGAALFFFVIKPYEIYTKRRPKDPTTKSCPECTSAIPLAAKRCPQCTAVLAETV